MVRNRQMVEVCFNMLTRMLLCLHLLFTTYAYAMSPELVRYVKNGECPGSTVFELITFNEMDALKDLVAKNLSCMKQTMNDQTTTLMVASYTYRPEVARFLIKQGVDPAAKNRHGQDALYFASYFGYLDLVKLLVNTGKLSKEAMSFAKNAALKKGQTEVATFLEPWIR